jgi:hypothetical protein
MAIKQKYMARNTHNSIEVLQGYDQVHESSCKNNLVTTVAWVTITG